MKPIHERATNYGAVGATAHFDFSRFPPKGFEVIQRRARIGHGRPRYDAAVAALRTWKVQRLSGIEVDVVGSEEGTVYRPVGFDGTEATRAASIEPQQDFGPDGEPFLQPGDSIDQRVRVLGMQIHAPMRVIAIEDEESSHGVILGTLEGHPEAGEERFTIEIVEDETVFLHFRALVRDAKWWVRLGSPIARAMRRRYHDRYMDVLRSIDVR
ncbi:DUF1990 domain-containing protein [Agrococcus sediminis]|uniref:DUF1990 domain-containing protein n=1 Tax=Agrococcus sediminis TaxID=2599924 RepID=A0A5M8QGL8_9MICO|nr:MULTISPECIES: DUF1990 domain-containing protein [Agrococcus]KAA6433876.1 DUF1990 domain-containing protein [Agrococcus sediminis]RWR25523.1 DUF1990 domain-containing protein [Agrococcus lahaulensis]UOW00640.1 DUF1990 domain-containing protein [Agrococcus sp. SCSIO52902]